MMTREGNRLRDTIVFGDGTCQHYTHARECTESHCACQLPFGTWLVSMVVQGGEHIAVVAGGDAWKQERSHGIER